MPGDLSNKLLQFEQVPPEGVWDKILGQMDAEEQTISIPLAGRILQTEVEPPELIWKKIQEELDQGTKIVSIRKGVSTGNIYRITAAAVMVGLVATSAWFVYKNKKSPEIRVAETKGIKPGNKATSSEDISMLPASETNKKNQAIASDKRANANYNPSQVTIKPRPAFETTNPTKDLAQNPADQHPEKLTDSHGVTPNDMNQMVSPNSYIMVTGPNGQSVRLSAKFNSLSGIFNDPEPGHEEYLDKVIKESSFWKEKFRVWREKMLNNDISPSLENFMNVSEMMDMLNEKSK